MVYSLFELSYAALHATVVSTPKMLSGLGDFYSSHYIAAARIYGFVQPTKTTYVNTDILQYLHLQSLIFAISYNFYPHTGSNS